MENNKDYKEHLAAVRDWGDNLEYVPEELKSPELCESAVEDYGQALAWVPEKLKTFELCEIAVSNSGYVLQYVPEEFKEELLKKCHDILNDITLIKEK